MFEALFASRAAETGPQGALRALDWEEIVARLTAARDLRALLARPTSTGGGFVPHAAAGIAGTAADERCINLGALAAGKWPDSITAAAARPAGCGDRDK